MKKLFLLSAMLLGIFVCNEAKANTDNFYAKVTVQVAEDSKGLGTVYIDNIDDQLVTEDVGSGCEMTSETGATVSFRMIITPAEGYAFLNFTDDNGDVYDVVRDENGNIIDPIIGVWASSKDQADPTVFNLYAHFVEESLLQRGELAEVTVPAEMKFGTFFCPVDVEIPEDFKAFTVPGVQDDAILLHEVTGKIRAFTPVVLMNTSLFDATISQPFSKEDLPEELPSLTTGLLTGVLEDSTVPMGSYAIEPNDDGEAVFVRVGDEDTEIAAYNCFLTVPESDLDSYRISELMVGINKILSNNGETIIFDMQGRRLEKLQKGINIVNGVKVIVE